MRNNLVLGIAAAAALTFSISACGGAATPTVTVTKEVTAAPAPAPQSQQEYESDMTFDPSEYLAYLRSKDSAFWSIEDGTAVEAGTSVCLALASNTSVDAIVTKAIDAGLTSTQSAAIIVGAVRYLCPQYADDVQRQVSAY
jgi:hypothetical protein